MRLQPDGRLALFNGARRAFDWNGLSAPFPQDQDLSDWVDMLLDQMEQYSQLPPPLRVRLDAVLRLAHRWAEPNLVQAYLHGRDFAQLLSIAPHLSVLDLGWARIEAWRTTSARFDRGRNALRWLAANKLKMVLAAICVMGLVLMYRDARDGTTYEKPGPTREQLANGLVTVHAQRAAPEVQPCQVRSPLSPPLGCPAAQTGQASPEPWPMAMPKALFITGAPALSYPPQAKSAGAKGTVWVRVMLDVQGKVLRSALIFPSGNSTLDQAAVVASSGVRMMPAIQDGNAVPSQAVLVFSYEIAAP
jgi:TonB family protein